jgi:hypothetical protein
MIKDTRKDNESICIELDYYNKFLNTLEDPIKGAKIMLRIVQLETELVNRLLHCYK